MKLRTAIKDIYKILKRQLKAEKLLAKNIDMTEINFVKQIVKVEIAKVGAAKWHQIAKELSPQEWLDLIAEYEEKYDYDDMTNVIKRIKKEKKKSKQKYGMEWLHRLYKHQEKV